MGSLLAYYGISFKADLLTAAAVSVVAAAAAVVSGSDAAVAGAAVAAEIENKQSDYNKPNGRILKPIAQTVHLCASFILRREGNSLSSLI